MVSRCQSSSKKLGHTSVFMQKGFKIRELPLVVKKVNDVLKLEEFNGSKNQNKSAENGGLSSISSQETSEFIENMNQTITVGSLFKFLETIPADKVNPPVAIHALKRIIHLNNNQARRYLEIHVSCDACFLYELY